MSDAWLGYQSWLCWNIFFTVIDNKIYATKIPGTQPPVLTANENDPMVYESNSSTHEVYTAEEDEDISHLEVDPSSRTILVMVLRNGRNFVMECRQGRLRKLVEGMC